MILVFWKTDCLDVNDQVQMLNDMYTEQLKVKGVKIVAMYVDCNGRTDHIKPLVFGLDLELEFYIDRNGSLKRAMNVCNIPFTVIYDEQMKSYCHLSGYVCRQLK